MPAAALLALSLLAAPAAADDYRQLAEGVAAAARKAGVKRVAIMPLESLGGADTNGATAVAERLVVKLAAQEGVQVVERALLDRVLSEQKLAQSGAMEPRGAQTLKLLGVEAIVTGSLIRTSARKVEVNLRLIHAVDARILGGSAVEVRVDWKEGGRLDEGMPTPPLPALDGDFVAWWERDALRQKVRTWASGRETAD